MFIQENGGESRKIINGGVYRASDLPYSGLRGMGRYSFRPCPDKKGFMVACRRGKVIRI